MAFILKSLGDSSYAWVGKTDYEEKGEESEESVKKSEVKDFADDLIYNSKLVSEYILIGNFHSKQDHIFASSDYSEEVFFPPESA